MQRTGVTDEVVVRFDGVTRQFGPDIRGLDDVSMTVRRGEIAVLLGLSGSGKSTLLRHVDGLQRPTSGTVTVLGTDVGRAGGGELATAPHAGRLHVSAVPPRRPAERAGERLLRGAGPAARSAAGAVHLSEGAATRGARSVGPRRPARPRVPAGRHPVGRSAAAGRGRAGPDAAPGDPAGRRTGRLAGPRVVGAGDAADPRDQHRAGADRAVQSASGEPCAELG